MSFEIISTAALAGSWKQFMLMYSVDDKDITCHTGDINQSKIFLEAFYWFFNVNRKNIKFDNLNHLPEKRQSEIFQLGYDFLENNSSYLSDRLYDDFIINNNEKNTITYSLIPMKHHIKGIDSNCYNVMKDLMIDSIDLGNSRDFKSTIELVNKINLLNNSKMYIGSNCSWGHIAQHFNVPSVFVRQFSPFCSLIG